MIQIQELLVLRQRAVADFPTGLLVIWALTVTVYCEPTGATLNPQQLPECTVGPHQLLKNTQNSGTDPAEIIGHVRFPISPP